MFSYHRQRAWLFLSCLFKKKKYIDRAAAISVPQCECVLITLGLLAFPVPHHPPSPTIGSTKSFLKEILLLVAVYRLTDWLLCLSIILDVRVCVQLWNVYVMWCVSAKSMDHSSIWMDGVERLTFNCWCSWRSSKWINQLMLTVLLFLMNTCYWTS